MHCDNPARCNRSEPEGWRRGSSPTLDCACRAPQVSHLLQLLGNRLSQAAPRRRGLFVCLCMLRAAVLGEHDRARPVGAAGSRDDRPTVPEPTSSRSASAPTGSSLQARGSEGILRFSGLSDQVVEARLVGEHQRANVPGIRPAVPAARHALDPRHRAHGTLRRAGAGVVYTVCLDHG